MRAVLLIIVLSCLATDIAVANPEKLKQLDNILEQLEEKLLKRERDNLNIGQGSRDAKTKTYTFQKEKVKAKLHHKTDFQKLNMAIEDIKSVELSS